MSTVVCCRLILQLIMLFVDIIFWCWCWSLFRIITSELEFIYSRFGKVCRWEDAVWRMPESMNSLFNWHLICPPYFIGTCQILFKLGTVPRYIMVYWFVVARHNFSFSLVVRRVGVKDGSDVKLIFHHRNLLNCSQWLYILFAYPHAQFLVSNSNCKKG